MVGGGCSYDSGGGVPGSSGRREPCELPPLLESA